MSGLPEAILETDRSRIRRNVGPTISVARAKRDFRQASRDKRQFPKCTGRPSFPGCSVIPVANYREIGQ